MKYTMQKALIVFLLGLTISGCTNVVSSNPSRTATEQLLISTAADRAASQFALQLPPDSKVYIDSSNFEGTDSKYAVGAIRSFFLKQDLRLVDVKKDADIVIEVRAGALSIDNQSFLIGIPEFSVPVPFASNSLTLPEIALYKSVDQKGVAKFVATSYDAKSGLLIHAGDPRYGFAHNSKHTILIFVSWTNNEALPDDEDVLTHAIDQVVPQASGN